MTNLLPLKIKTDFFKKVQERNENIKAKDIDSQFNIIINYINSSLVNALNQLIGDTLPGTLDPSKIGANLINVGDGTTKWDFPRGNFLLDNSVNLNKLKQLNIGSIIVTDENSTFTDIAPNSYGLALVSRLNKSPVWQKINNLNINNRTITSEKLAKNTLTESKFAFDISRKYIKKIIKNVFIKENDIDGKYKLAKQSIEKKHFDNSFLPKIFSFTTKEMIPDKAIQMGNNIRINTDNKSLNYKKISPNFKLTNTSFSFQPYTIADNAITSRNIADRTIDLLSYRGSTIKDQKIVKTYVKYFEQGCIGKEQLPIRYQQILGL